MPSVALLEEQSAVLLFHASKWAPILKPILQPVDPTWI